MHFKWPGRKNKELLLNLQILSQICTHSAYGTNLIKYLHFVGHPPVDIRHDDGSNVTISRCHIRSRACHILMSYGIYDIKIYHQNRLWANKNMVSLTSLPTPLFHPLFPLFAPFSPLFAPFSPLFLYPFYTFFFLFAIHSKAYFSFFRELILMVPTYLLYLSSASVEGPSRPSVVGRLRSSPAISSYWV